MGKRHTPLMSKFRGHRASYWSVDIFSKPTVELYVPPVAFAYRWYASVTRRTNVVPDEIIQLSSSSLMVSQRTGINNACRVAQDCHRTVCDGLIDSPESTSLKGTCNRPIHCHDDYSNESQVSSRIMERANKLRRVDATCRCSSLSPTD